MDLTLGIRKEDKNKWEKRTPITPKHTKLLKENYGIQTVIQPSLIRIFSDDEYKKIGAEINRILSKCKVIFGIKEMPIDFFEKNKVYVFFSHTIKGQEYNMPMLKKMMEMNCTLIDYERITDEKGRRLVFFGRYAGLAGMIDTLWAFGKKLEQKKIKQPFSMIKKTIEYDSLHEAKKHLKEIAGQINKNGLPKNLTPLVIGFAGYGNVSKGAQEIIDLLPVRDISPSEIESICQKPSNKCIYKIVFKEEDMVRPRSTDKEFELEDYYNNPEKYESKFEGYVPYLDILMNCIYWDERYPRLITKDYLKKSFGKKDFSLKVIGDISVDIEGAIESTVKSTTPDMPVFVYNPLNGEIKNGYSHKGIVTMAVDNLPCELPRDSSISFSKSLFPFIPDILKADYNVNFKNLNLPSEIKNAVILYQGDLTPNYKYIDKFLKKVK